MTDKAYIVTNKEQELDVLKKFERKGLFWRVGRNAIDFVPSENSVFNNFASFPYAMIEKEFIIWSPIEQLEDEEIVYDGRKEEKMTKKYKVTNEFMDKLVEWCGTKTLDATNGDRYNYVCSSDLDELPRVAKAWWYEGTYSMERNHRLIAIIQWLNGEDVFEVDA